MEKGQRVRYRDNKVKGSDEQLVSPESGEVSDESCCLLAANSLHRNNEPSQFAAPRNIATATRTLEGRGQSRRVPLPPAARSDAEQPPDLARPV